MGVDVWAWAGGPQKCSQVHTFLPIFYLPGRVTGTQPRQLSGLWRGPHSLVEHICRLVTKAWLPVVHLSPTQHHPLHRRETEAQTR